MSLGYTLSCDITRRLNAVATKQTMALSDIIGRWNRYIITSEIKKK